MANNFMYYHLDRAPKDEENPAKVKWPPPDWENRKLNNEDILRWYGKAPVAPADLDAVVGYRPKRMVLNEDLVDYLAVMEAAFPEEEPNNEPDIEPIEEVKEVKSEEELLKLCHEIGKRLNKEVNIEIEHGGLNTFCCVNEKGDVEDFVNQACINDLSHTSLSPEFVVDTLYTYKMDTYKEDLDRYAVNYLDWLFNRSPYSPCIATRDAKEVYGKGYYILKGESPSNLVGGAMVAVRMLWERQYIVKTWNKLVGLGVDENLAFVIAHGFNCVSGPLKRIDRLFGHIAIDVYIMDIEDVKLFLSNSPRTLNKPLKEDANYMGIHRMFSKRANDENDNSFPRKLEKYLSNIVFEKKDVVKKAAPKGYEPLFTPALNKKVKKKKQPVKSYNLEKYAPYLTKITYQTIEELLS